MCRLPGVETTLRKVEIWLLIDVRSWDVYS